jgi:hypothetical protein
MEALLLLRVDPVVVHPVVHQAVEVQEGHLLLKVCILNMRSY